MQATRKIKELETLAVINIACLVCYFIFRKDLILKIQLLFSFFCLLLPIVLTWVHIVWVGFFSFIGKINAALLLSIVFFLFLTPIALLQKLFSNKKIAQKEGNYFIRNHVFSKKDLERMG